MIWLYIGIGVVLLAGGLLVPGYIAFGMAHNRKPAKLHQNHTGVDPVAPWRDIIDPAVERLKAGPWEDLYITSHDGLKLHAVYFDRGCEDTVICFHGFHSTPFGDFSIGGTFYLDEGYNVLFVDQRSHGQSEGKYITYGIHERKDAALWVEHIAPRVKGRIFLCGISMGAATVMMAANQEMPKVAGIMADCGFTSPREIIAKVIRHKMGMPDWPICDLMNWWCRWLGDFSQTEWSTERALAEAKYPVLFFHGTADDYVPFEMTQRSFDACTSEKEFVVVEGAGHGQSFLMEPERCKAATRAFMERCR